MLGSSRVQWISLVTNSTFRNSQRCQVVCNSENTCILGPDVESVFLKIFPQWYETDITKCRPEYHTFDNTFDRWTACRIYLSCSETARVDTLPGLNVEIGPLCMVLNAPIAIFVFPCRRIVHQLRCTLLLVEVHPWAIFLVVETEISTRDSNGGHGAAQPDFGLIIWISRSKTCTRQEVPELDDKPFYLWRHT
jgi:hypothetical protein